MVSHVGKERGLRARGDKGAGPRKRGKSAKAGRTYQGGDTSSLGNFCLGLAQDLVGVRAVEWGLESNPAQAPGPPQLQQGLLAAHQGQHGLHKGPALRTPESEPCCCRHAQGGTPSTNICLLTLLDTV